MPKRARKDLDVVQEKRARVVELRSRGLTWDQIAAQTGYSNGSAASKAWRVAIKQHPDQSVDEVRRQEKTRLEQMDSVMSGIISNPPIRATSIGRVMWDPRTCTCGVRGDTKRDHAEDCRVQPVLDAGAVVRASSERRALGESLRKLVGADAAAPMAVVDARTQIVVAEINQGRAGKGLPPLTIPAPAGATISVEQASAAARAALNAAQPWAEQRRAEVQAELFAAAGQPPPPDARAILKGEIVDE